LRDGTSGRPSSKDAKREDAKREEALDVSSASWAAAAGREKYDESYPRPWSTGVEEERILVMMTGPCSANDELETPAMSSSAERRTALLLSSFTA
jgi:hypothetical protein